MFIKLDRNRCKYYYYTLSFLSLGHGIWPKQFFYFTKRSILAWSKRRSFRRWLDSSRGSVLDLFSRSICPTRHHGHWRNNYRVEHSRIGLPTIWNWCASSKWAIHKWRHTILDIFGPLPPPIAFLYLWTAPFKNDVLLIWMFSDPLIPFVMHFYLILMPFCCCWCYSLTSEY